jgi:hypothetical protein
MTDTMTVTMTAPAPTGRRKRGRETALDMVRSLAVVFLLVLPMWYFGQSSPGDSKRIRPVDPAPALAAYRADTGGPVPHTPKGWVVNVARYDAGVVRVGFVVGDHYTEFSAGSAPTFLETAAGKGSVLGTVHVGGQVWQRYASTDGHESLLRMAGGTRLLVGGIREDVSLEQLETLAATVR